MTLDGGNVPQNHHDQVVTDRPFTRSGFFVLGFIMFVSVLFCLGMYADRNAGKDRIESAKLAEGRPAQTVIPYNSHDLIAEVRKDLASKAHSVALDDIGKLNEADMQRPDVQKFRSVATRQLQILDVQAKRIARVAYVKDYERELLNAGGDYTVRAQGPNADVLSVTFVLINRPFVYQTQNNKNLNSMWRSMGFKTVRLSDGFDSSWSYKL